MDKIRKAGPEDIPQVTAIYDHILTEEEAGRGVTGWIRGAYPTERTALDALNTGTLFVLERDGVIAASARIDQIQSEEYAAAPWQYSDAPDDQIMVLHTLVVEPALAGQGCGGEFVRFYERYALEHGCPYLRIDTNIRNTVARRLYARLGYREAGVVPCEFNGIPDVRLACLEKRLEG